MGGGNWEYIAVRSLYYTCSTTGSRITPRLGGTYPREVKNSSITSDSPKLNYSHPSVPTVILEYFNIALSVIRKRARTESH